MAVGRVFVAVDSTVAAAIAVADMACWAAVVSIAVAAVAVAGTLVHPLH